MTEERRRVLDMLSEGKVSVDEAERLLKALQGTRRVETREGGEEPRARSENENGAGGESYEAFGESFEEGFKSFGEGYEALGESFEEGFKPFGENFEAFDEPDEKSKTSMRDDTFTVGDKPRLVVRGFNGRVRVKTGSPGSMRVRAKLKNPHSIKYSAVQEGDRVIVEAIPDRQSGGFLPGPFGNQRGVDLEVVVPVAAGVDLATRNGAVEVRGTEGGGTLRTSNGRIKVERFKGELEANTSNGAVTLKTFSGSAEVATSNSRVSIEDGRGRFDASTTNGSIRFQGRMAPGTVNRLSTSNGIIKVALDADPSLKLTAATVNGRVRCEVPGFVATVDRRRKVEGMVGKGEAELTAKTTNGSISIQ